MIRFLTASICLLACISTTTWCSAQTAPPLVTPGGYIHEFDLSPDGATLIWLAESDNQKRLYRRDLASSTITPFAKAPGLKAPHWSGDNRHVYVQADQGGDEKYHVLLFDPDNPGAAPVDLTPYPGKTALLVDTNRADGSALVAINLTAADSFGLYRIRPNRTAPELVDPGVPGRLNWLIDLKGEMFGHVQTGKDGSVRVETRPAGAKKWNGFTLPGSRWRSGEQVRNLSEPLPDGSAWFLVRGGLDGATPQRLDLASGKMLESLPGDGIDTEQVMFELDGRPLLVQSVPGYPLIRIFDPAFRKLLESVPLPIHSFLKETSSNLTLTKFILTFMSESGEENMVLLDRTAAKAQVLFHQGSPLPPDHLPRTLPITVTARDKLSLQGYLTLPPEQEARNLPLVLLVHGGPWVRDVWAYDPIVSFLSLKGYAVLRVNFRGSGGFGRAFEDAGVGEWGGKMQDDLTDSACWAVAQGVADPKRLVIMGGSYGGYAAIEALVKTPHLFAAAIEQDGPADLPAMLDEMQPVAQPFKPILLQFIGNDRAQQWDRSPLAHVERIERPLLGVQGVNDPRIRATQLQKLEQAMRAHDKDITTLYFSGEGHGVSNGQNFMSFMQTSIAFLEEKLHNPANASVPQDYCGAASPQ